MTNMIFVAMVADDISLSQRVWLLHGMLMQLPRNNSLGSKDYGVDIDVLAQPEVLATPQSLSHDQVHVLNVHTDAGCSHQD